jgi:CheY-like chemotaxis protein
MRIRIDREWQRSGRISDMARFLIVEDEPLIAALLAGYVEDLGHDVLGPVATVSEALSLIDAHQPEFTILDFTLGREESAPVADALVQRNLPFAFATGHGFKALPDRFRSAQLISKPYVFEDVQRLAQRWAQH